MVHLSTQKCVACEGGIPPLTRAEAEEFLVQVPEWKISDDNKIISRLYSFDNFTEALVFVNRVGRIAKSEDHHPDIHLTDYRNVLINLTTHAIGGLSKNDFIVAAKIDDTKNHE